MAEKPKPLQDSSGNYVEVYQGAVSGTRCVVFEHCCYYDVDALIQWLLKAKEWMEDE